MRVYTVSQVNQHIKGLFDADEALQAIFVRVRSPTTKWHTPATTIFP